MDLIKQFDNDYQFYRNNVLSSEDWDNDFPNIFDLNCQYLCNPNDDFLSLTGDALGGDGVIKDAVFEPCIGPNRNNNTDFYDTSWESSDSGDSGFHSPMAIKSEPVSPISASVMSDIGILSNVHVTQEVDLNDLIKFDDSAVMELADTNKTQLENDGRVITKKSHIVEYSSEDIPVLNIVETETVEQNDILSDQFMNESVFADYKNVNSGHNIILSQSHAVGSINYQISPNAQNTSGCSVVIFPNSKSGNLPLSPKHEISPPLIKTKTSINELLNTKVELRPKPTLDNSAISSLGHNFLALNSSIPNNQNIKKEPLPVKRSYSASSNNSNSSEACMDAEDLKAYKKQLRMMKNRESATHSRQRQKTHLANLQQQLNEYAEQNKQLVEENEALRERVNQLQSENALMISKGFSISSPAVKTAACVFTFCFLMSLNLVNFYSFLPLKSNDVELSPLQTEYIYRGRTLKSLYEPTEIDDLNTNSEVNFSKLSDTVANNQINNLKETSSFYENLIKLHKAGFKVPQDTLCFSNFNSTESVRLMRELTGWVNGHKEEIKKMKLSKKRKLTKRPLSLFPNHVQSRQDNKAGQVYQMTGKDPSDKYEIQFLDHEGIFDQPFQSEVRRNDTFYVVSFKMDHVLLPATSYNKTARPRMSLIMPTSHLNNSMMQIDCEVLATQHVKLKKSFVSTYMNNRREFNNRKFNSFN